MRRDAWFYSILVLILGSTLTAQHPSTARWGRYSGPKSLGLYSLDHDTSMKSLLGHFGTQPTGRDTYCFSDSKHGLYLYARPTHDRSGPVAEVVLSSFPNCKGLPTTTATIAPDLWKTSAGFGIGSTKEEVVHAYGDPVFITKLEKSDDLGLIAGIREAGTSRISVGESSYLYSCLLNEKESCKDDGRSTRIGFSGGKIIWIQVANSE